MAKYGDAATKKVVLGAVLGKLEPSEANIAKAVAQLYAGSSLEDTKQRVELVKSAKTAELRTSKDPLIRLALALRPETQARDDRADAESGDFRAGEAALRRGVA